MADKRGWWSLSMSVIPTEADLEHIAELIKQGYTSGEICKDEDDNLVIVDESSMLTPLSDEELKVLLGNAKVILVGDFQPMTVRELCEMHEELYDYDYKWIDSTKHIRLSDVLERLGYKLVDCDCEGEYNDIKGYYNCVIEKI